MSNFFIWLVSLQFKLLHNCSFSKPGIINKIITQLHLIPIRCDEVGEAWLFLTVNRVDSFICIMPWGFLNSTTNQQTKIMSLHAEGQKSPCPHSLQRERAQEEASRKNQKCGVCWDFRRVVSRPNAPFHYLTAALSLLVWQPWPEGPWLNPVSSCSLTPVPAALLNLEQLLPLWSRTGKGVLLQALS